MWGRDNISLTNVHNKQCFLIEASDLLLISRHVCDCTTHCQFLNWAVSNFVNTNNVCTQLDMPCLQCDQNYVQFSSIEGLSLCCRSGASVSCQSGSSRSAAANHCSQKTQDEPQAKNSLHNTTAACPGKKIQNKTIPLHCWESRVFKFLGPHRDSGEDLVSKQKSKIKKAPGSWIGENENASAAFVTPCCVPSRVPPWCCAVCSCTFPSAASSALSRGSSGDGLRVPLRRPSPAGSCDSTLTLPFNQFSRKLILVCKEWLVTLHLMSWSPLKSHKNVFLPHWKRPSNKCFQCKSRRNSFAKSSCRNVVTYFVKCGYILWTWINCQKRDLRLDVEHLRQWNDGQNWIVLQNELIPWTVSAFKKMQAKTHLSKVVAQTFHWVML